MIKNSKACVEEAKTWHIDPEEIQVSYVVALYPSVTITKTTIIKTLKQELCIN